ncbi:small GTP-binding protein domain [Allomyces macrogynus ATCC 38327]|uniref:Small GTP-binding protein domain n=1 Tax=Allomyces macrogynus (strain ATCC 38327) TaxID=578462 RepID=A0A0L0SL75_ALLM3|nr:small GTP-binding protein domain [Allomyces macrogynus ATCC 38327]|eukprot:KNE63130.1 small GTP-binding protein domain [Allomyces macrogynus ATCC 38327]
MADKHCPQSTGDDTSTEKDCGPASARPARPAVTTTTAERHARALAALNRRFGTRQRTDATPRIKIVTLGDAASGKSCLIRRYCERRYTSKYIATIGIDYGLRQVLVRDQPVKVNFWDMAGDRSYFHIRNEFYRDTHGVILTFDVTVKKSFSALETWAKELAACSRPTATADGAEISASGFALVLVGNKIDAPKRAISRDDAEALARRLGCPYVECSAKTGENVDALFDRLFEAVVDRLLGGGQAVGRTDIDSRLESAAALVALE